ncbi:MAG: hypothetical protein IT373_28275 [Polyangiaceae bacterium]|nr:hypothetical protein [Polyangiaceae bacterium]
MKARAPGKLVLSGAYAVLEGATAIVAAVDRYATADSSAPASFVTAEVAAAIARGALVSAPAFDAAPLRAATDGRSRKLGLGSSAAILVASIATALGEAGLGGHALAQEAFARALPAHRVAQGGGSGVDVAASAHGGVVRCRLELAASPEATVAAAGPPLEVAPVALPAGLHVHVVASQGEVATRSMLGAVRALAREAPERYAAWLARARVGSDAALAATTAGAFVAALDEQFRALAELGRAAGVPIVTPAMECVARQARVLGATFGPSGAGGGDVALYVGTEALPAELVACAAREGLERLEVALGARGVHLVEDGAPSGAEEPS